MNDLKQFHGKVHFWGRISIVVALIMCMSIPVYLTFVLGYVPSANDIITGLISIVGFVGVVWIVEPISYFPILGPAGTYMSFLSGNIGNMRLPVIAAAQDALDLEPGSQEAELAGIFALVTSTLTNLFVLAIVMVAGQVIVDNLPPKFLAAFNYALPGILGAMLVMMGSKIKGKYTAIILAMSFAILVILQIMPYIGVPKEVTNLLGNGATGIVAVFVIIYSLYASKRDHAGSN